MTRVFLAGPVRKRKDRALLEQVEKAMIDAGASVFVPHKAIRVLPRRTRDLAPLYRNLHELERCDVAVFLLDQERTGTGIELGYLYGLVVTDRSRATLIGFSRSGDIDLMARFCLSKLGAVVSSIESLLEAIRSRAPASDV